MEKTSENLKKKSTFCRRQENRFKSRVRWRIPELNHTFSSVALALSLINLHAVFFCLVSPRWGSGLLLGWQCCLSLSTRYNCTTIKGNEAERGGLLGGWEAPLTAHHVEVTAQVSIGWWEETIMLDVLKYCKSWDLTLLQQKSNPSFLWYSSDWEISFWLFFSVLNIFLQTFVSVLFLLLFTFLSSVFPLFLLHVSKGTPFTRVLLTSSRIPAMGTKAPLFRSKFVSACRTPPCTRMYFCSECCSACSYTGGRCLLLQLPWSVGLFFQQQLTTVTKCVFV